MATKAAERARMDEAKELIEFYEKRGSNWLNALEFTLAKGSGRWPHFCYPNKNRAAAIRSMGDE